MADNSCFIQRRQQLLSQLAINSICVIPAARLVTRSRDTEYPFRQHSDFYYLTGFNEPEAWLLLSNHPRLGGAHSALVCLDKNPLAEIWHGRRVGPELAKESFDLDATMPLDDIETVLGNYLDGHSHLYFAQGEDEESEALLMSVMTTLRNAPKQSKSAPQSVVDIRPILHEMRLFKSEQELNIMQQAADISVAAHKRAMACAKPGMFEYQLQAELEHEFARCGARYPAYNSIVGGGDNACILHYTENTDRLDDGDLVLIDAGCELEGYAADITRTFPVNGKFSEPQKQLYQLVLDAQLAALEVLRPGNTIPQAMDTCVEVITRGLLELGILSGDIETNLQDKSWRQYFMHGLGHWLGLDVHDVGNYKVEGKDRPLQPGMVMTVEPGLYIAADAEVDPKWQGIGIRIEDNIVITEQGHINMTAAVPKAIDDIEILMAEQGG